MWGLQRLIGGMIVQLVSGSKPWVGRAALATLLVCAGSLVWVYWLGGWRLLVP